MKFLVGCLFIAVLACFFSSSYAQAPNTAIHGKVLTEGGLSAEGSTIILLKLKDSSAVSSAIADKNGEYRISGFRADKYLLLVRKVGFDNYYAGPFQLLHGQNFAAPDITLKFALKELKEVAVTGKRPAIEVRPGKIILNVQNSLLAEGNSAFDILRQSPAVRVDNGNNISIIGRQSALITIDGKPTNLSGDDLVSVLRSMQSSSIDRIELITSGSAKYDASAGGVINIVTRKGTNTGTNGSVTGSLGYGKYFKGSGGIIFNDRTDKVNIFGSYNYSYNKTFHDFYTDRIIDFNNLVSDYHVDYNSIQISKANTFNFGTDFYLSATQTIGFLVSGSITDDGYVKDNNLKISNQSTLDSIITANSNLNRHLSKVNYNINYLGKLDKSGTTLSADFNYYTYERTSAEYITNEFFDALGNTYREPAWLQNLSPSNIKIWLSKVDFTDPISKTSKLEAGLKYSNVTSNNDLIFGPNIGGVYTSDPRFSNHFVYTENVNVAYVNYENKLDRFDLTTGLRAEQTIAKGNSITMNQVVNSNYLDFFPQLQLTYKYDDKHDFSLSYNRGIHRPDYQAINPFLYYVDLYDFGAGNPNLKPEYSNLFALTYNYNKSLITTLYSNTISNAYDFNFYEQNDTSKVNITTRKNLGKIYNYGIKLFAPAVFTSWWNANFSVDASYQRYVAYPENGNLDKGTQDIIFSSTQYFMLSNTVSAELSGNYESPNFYGINQIKANYAMNAAIGKQLFNKRGSIKLNVADVFNTLRDRGHTNYQNLDYSITDKKESQVVKLTFTYRFGKTTVKATSTHNTGNEEEQKRTKTSVSN